MSKPTPPTYRTTNWRSYNTALKQRGSLTIRWLNGDCVQSPLSWFDPETVWLAPPRGKRGRSATFTDAAIEACLTLKALFGLPLRQTTGLVASLLELAGLDWPVPDFSTLCRRQNGLCVAIPYRPSTGALHLLIASTGIKAEGEGSGAPRNTGHRSHANGAKCILASTPTLWKSGQSTAPAAGSGTRRCSPNCWTRSPPTSLSARSPRTGL